MYHFPPQKMNVKNRRSSAVTVPAVSPACAIIHQKLWQKLEELRGGGEREGWEAWLLPGREKRRASGRKQVRLLRRPNRAGWWCAEASRNAYRAPAARSSN